jgi:hypothetical protein
MATAIRHDGTPSGSDASSLSPTRHRSSIFSMPTPFQGHCLESPVKGKVTSDTNVVVQQRRSSATRRRSGSLLPLPEEAEGSAELRVDHSARAWDFPLSRSEKIHRVLLLLEAEVDASSAVVATAEENMKAKDEELVAMQELCDDIAGCQHALECENALLTERLVELEENLANGLFAQNVANASPLKDSTPWSVPTLLRISGAVTKSTNGIYGLSHEKYHGSHLWQKISAPHLWIARFPHDKRWYVTTTDRNGKADGNHLLTLMQTDWESAYASPADVPSWQEAIGSEWKSQSDLVIESFQASDTPRASKTLKRVSARASRRCSLSSMCTVRSTDSCSYLDCVAPDGAEDRQECTVFPQEQMRLSSRSAPFSLVRLTGEASGELSEASAAKGSGTNDATCDDRSEVGASGRTPREAEESSSFSFQVPVPVGCPLALPRYDDNQYDYPMMLEEESPRDLHQSHCDEYDCGETPFQDPRERPSDNLLAQLLLSAPSVPMVHHAAEDVPQHLSSMVTPRGPPAFSASSSSTRINGIPLGIGCLNLSRQTPRANAEEHVPTCAMPRQLSSLVTPRVPLTGSCCRSPGSIGAIRWGGGVHAVDWLQFVARESCNYEEQQAGEFLLEQGESLQVLRGSASVADGRAADWIVLVTSKLRSKRIGASEGSVPTLSFIAVPGFEICDVVIGSDGRISDVKQCAA